MDLRGFLREAGEKAGAALEAYLGGCGLILFFGKPDAPAPPDYVGAAREQGAANLQTEIANRILGQTRQVTPFGTLEYSQIGTTHLPGPSTTKMVWRNGKLVPVTTTAAGPSIPQFESRVVLTPEVGNLLSSEFAARTGLAGLLGRQTERVGEALAQPFELGGEEARRRVEDALYGRATRYLDPQWEEAERAERTRLANQGFSVGTEGMTRALDEFSRRKQAAYESAREAAIGGGLAERQQQVREALLQRQQPLSELSALMGGAAAPLPEFAGLQPGGAAPAPLFQAASSAGEYAGDVYNADVAAYNNMMRGLYGLGAAAILARMGKGAVAGPAGFIF